MENQRSYAKIGPYIFIKKIGSGSFSRVFAVLNEVDQQLFTCKIIQKHNMDRKEVEESLKTEMRVMTQCQHGNVQSGIDIFSTPRYICIVQEYAVGGDLLTEVHRADGVTEHHARSIFAQIVEGLQYLHSKNIVHRDIKPENVLLFKDGTVRLTDFGLSTFLPTSKTSSAGEEIVNSMLSDDRGTDSYKAPEILRRCENTPFCGFRADIWSLGVTLYAMVANRFPFEDENPMVQRAKIVYDPALYPGYFSAALEDLLRNILRKDPEKRFTIDQIKRHPWLNGGSELVPPSRILRSWKLSKTQYDRLRPMLSGRLSRQKTAVHSEVKGDLDCLGPALDVSEVQRSFSWLPPGDAEQHNAASSSADRSDNGSSRRNFTVSESNCHDLLRRGFRKIAACLSGRYR